MCSRTRVLDVLNGRVPDRVPIVLGVSNATGLKMQVYRRLKQILQEAPPVSNGATCSTTTCSASSEELTRPEEYMYTWPELGTASPDEATLIRLGTDVRSVFDLEPAHVLARNRSREPHAQYIDSWGSGSSEVEPGNWFPNVHPLKDATTVEEIMNYSGWPDMNDPTRVAHVAAQAKLLHDQGQYAVMGVPWLMFPLERAFAMQGTDTFLANMATYPDMCRALLRRNTDLCECLFENFLRDAGQYFDLIKIGDDLGTQTSLLMSPRMYRSMLKPLHAELIKFIKARTSAKIFFHTDGDIFPLLEDLIEIGVDVLNPIQTSAGKMSDLVELKRRCNKRIVLCGAIDTQHVLPHGTPEEVRSEVQRVIAILGKDGGYMLSSVHSVMNEVPAENVLAMVDACQDYRGL